jgi:hypothetical protein
MLLVGVRPKLCQEQFVAVCETLEKTVCVKDDARFLLGEGDAVDEGKQRDLGFGELGALEDLRRRFAHLP